MKRHRTFKALFKDAQGRDDYWVQQAALTFTENVERLLRQRGMTRKRLAELLGSSPAYVTKLLRGDVNCTLRTMVRVSRALGAEFTPFIQVAGHAASTVAASRAALRPFVVSETIRLVVYSSPPMTSPFGNTGPIYHRVDSPTTRPGSLRAH